MSLHLQNIDHVVGGQTHISGVNLELEPGSFNVLLGRTRWRAKPRSCV